MKVSDLQDALTAIQTVVGPLPDQLTKVQTEITTEIDNLKNNNPDLPQTVVDSVTAIQASVAKLGPIVQQLDDLNPDTPPPAK